MTRYSPALRWGFLRLKNLTKQSYLLKFQPSNRLTNKSLYDRMKIRNTTTKRKKRKNGGYRKMAKSTKRVKLETIENIQPNTRVIDRISGLEGTIINGRIFESYGLGFNMYIQVKFDNHEGIYNAMVSRLDILE